MPGGKVWLDGWWSALVSNLFLIASGTIVAKWREVAWGLTSRFSTTAPPPVSSPDALARLWITCSSRRWRGHLDHRKGAFFSFVFQCVVGGGCLTSYEAGVPHPYEAGMSKICSKMDKIG